MTKIKIQRQKLTQDKCQCVYKGVLISISVLWLNCLLQQENILLCQVVEYAAKGNKQLP